MVPGFETALVLGAGLLCLAALACSDTGDSTDKSGAMPPPIAGQGGAPGAGRMAANPTAGTGGTVAGGAAGRSAAGATAVPTSGAGAGGMAGQMTGGAG